MTLTKSDITDLISNQLDCSKSKSSEIVETLFETMKRSMEDGEDVLISGFGKFCVKEKKERKGRNPATGDDLMLSTRKVVTFKYSDVLKDRVNGK